MALICWDIIPKHSWVLRIITLLLKSSELQGRRVDQLTTGLPPSPMSPFWPWMGVSGTEQVWQVPPAQDVWQLISQP